MGKNCSPRHLGERYCPALELNLLRPSQFSDLFQMPPLPGSPQVLEPPMFVFCPILSDGREVHPQRIKSSELPDSQESEPASFAKLRTVPTLSNLKIPCAERTVLGPPLGVDKVTAAKALGGGLLMGPQRVEDQAWMPFADPELIEHLLPCMPGPAGEQDDKVCCSCL